MGKPCSCPTCDPANWPDRDLDWEKVGEAEAPTSAMPCPFKCALGSGEVFVEMAAALRILAPDYIEALEHRDSWRAKADTDYHPGRPFSLTQAERWDGKAREILAALASKERTRPAAAVIVPKEEGK